jgi:TonB-linked SusC/RagA family outer membrane protein
MELKKLKCRWRITLLLSFGFFLTATGLQAQNETTQQETINLTGNIQDNLGTNLEGVTVRNLTSGKTVISDAKGFFKIEASKGDSLSASFIGYDDYRWQFNSIIVQNIVMNPIAGGLNDVAVVGYGRQKKVSLVGAQSSVRVQELKQPVANLNTMLAGRISGLVGVQRSGLPGSNSADIWIRGISTFGGSGSGPLVIIDGVQGRSLNDLDPEDIDDFTILKDATSTAVYGALGANGVIIVNTKRGKVGKVNLMANYMEGITAFTKVQDMADASTYMNLKNEAALASDLPPFYTQDYIDSTLDPSANHYVYPNVDWLDQLFNKTSRNRRFNFSARGGSENVQFYTSLAYYEEGALLKTDGLQNYDAGTKYQRYNFVSNVDMKWTKTTKFFLGINGYISQFNQPGSGAEAAFNNSMNISPVRYPIMYPGNLVSGIAEGSTPSPNPWADITQTGYKETFRSKIATTAKLSQELDFITKGLSGNVQYTFDTYSTNNQNRTRQRSVYYISQTKPYNDDGSLNLEQVISGVDVLSYGHDASQDRQFSLQGQLNWHRTFGDHDLQAMVVYSQLSEPNPTADNYQDAIPTRQQNYAGRLTYGYKDKYFAEYDAGYTGSQVFSPENRYAFFPSIGVGWVLSNESWWKPLSNVFNFFKLRYSNGFSGAIGGTRFDYITTITDAAKGINFGTPSDNVHYDGINIRHYGANVTWAKSHDQDVGLEFNILNNKLTFVFDWFEKNRSGIFLTRANFPAFAGLQYQPDGNYGKTLNRGFDGTIELLPVPLTDKLSISFRGTFTYNKTVLNENGAAPYDEIFNDPRGQTILTNYGYVAEGLFQSEAEIATHANQSGVGGNPRVGDIKYKDLNGDGVVNDLDQTYIGHGDVAPWTYGFGMNLQYGNWYLSAFFEGVQGADRVISGNARSPFSGAEDNNVYAKAVDRWTEENHAEHPFYPRLAYGKVPNANNNVTSTWWVKDISFIRFKTLNFGYNLPNKIFKHTGFKNATLYFDAVNLCYWSPFKLWDPEMNTGNGNTYPNTRNIAIGFKVNFD